MLSVHKSKTLATLLASTLGGAGLHRFYLFGRKDVWGWVHFCSVPVSILAMIGGNAKAPELSLFFMSPAILSALAAVIEALVLGLTPDTDWDAKFNLDSGRVSDSNWLLVLILVVSLAGGMTGLIFVISRTFDLIFTGGAYG